MAYCTPLSSPSGSRPPIRHKPGSEVWHVLAVNQDVVIRLGLVSWLGFSMIAGGVGILVSSRSRGAEVLAWGSC
jgi:hypothetical protein